MDFIGNLDCEGLLKFFKNENYSQAVVVTDITSNEIASLSEQGRVRK